MSLFYNLKLESYLEPWAKLEGANGRDYNSAVKGTTNEKAPSGSDQSQPQKTPLPKVQAANARKRSLRLSCLKLRTRAVHHFSESKNGVKLALNHKFRSQPRFQENETRSNGLDERHELGTPGRGARAWVRGCEQVMSCPYLSLRRSEIPIPCNRGGKGKPVLPEVCVHRD